MNIQTILLIVGIVLLVVAAGLAAAAVWAYRKLNIKGVRDDLSGVARVKEIEEAGASGNRVRRGSRVRAFSEAAWGGKVTSRREATTDKPTDALAGNATTSSRRASDTTTDALTTENSGTDALTTGDAPTDLIDEKTSSKAHSSPPQAPPPRHSSPPGSKARFNFRVVRKQIVCGSPNGIEG